MIDISNTYKQKIIDELINTKLEIVFSDGDCATITEKNIASESLKLKQAISDENSLKFGGCIASEFEIDLINTVDRTFDNSLNGKSISVRLTQTFPSGEKLLPSETLLPSINLLPGETTVQKEWYVFSGFIDSTKADKSDSNKRHIIAYDAFAKLYNLDGTATLMSILKSAQSGYTWIRNVLVICLNMLYQNFGVGFDNTNYDTYLNEIINQSTGKHLYECNIQNDDWAKDNNTITIGEIIKSICEMIGTFGFIKPNNGKGIFNIISLGNTAEQYNFYESFYAEENKSLGYTGFETLNGDADRDNKIMEIDCFISPEDVPDNFYDLTKNACCWQKWNGQGIPLNHDLMDMLHSNSGNRMYLCDFTPITATLDGRLWVEVGEKIKIVTKKVDVDGDYVTDNDGNVITEIIESYILSRTLSGIHALTDEIEAKGGN